MRKHLALVLLFAGCAAEGNNSPDPPDDSYHPGTPQSGEYGSGSGSGTGSSPDLGGPPQCDTSLRLCPHGFIYPGGSNEKTVTVIGSFDNWGAGVPMTLNGGSWQATVNVAWDAQTVYKFHVTYSSAPDAWLPDPNNPTQVDDGYGGKNSVLSGVECLNWSCALPSTPPGPPGAYDWRDAVLYFTFVDRFVNGDHSNDKPIVNSNLKDPANYWGGDWAGVKQKIDDGYFKSLGVNTLWLTVPMDNSESVGLGDDGQYYSGYHGYWPRNLDQAESRFGTLDELKALITDAHQNSMRVILDYAMNHVHQDSPIYQMHMNDGWFNPLLVNGQQCICGSTICPWESPAKLYCWFRDYLPDFNFNNADARKYSVDNVLWWIQGTGADGLRLDAIKHVELSWLTDLRTRLNTDVEPVTGQHVYLVGETFTGDQSLIKSFIDPLKMLDGQFDFPLRAQVNSTLLLRAEAMSDFINFMNGNTGYYGSAVMSTFIGNHDVPRVIHFAQDSPLWTDVWANGRDRSWTNQPGVVTETSAYERVAVAMAVLMTNQGIPLIYYGDEVGMPGAGDPDNRRPMQWDSYNDGQKLLLTKMQKLGALRAAHVAFRRGTRTTLSQGADTWAYSMTAGSDQVFVAVNRGDGTASVGGLPAQNLTDQMTGDVLAGPTVSVPPRTVRILTP
jgi:glycosidase